MSDTVNYCSCVFIRGHGHILMAVNTSVSIRMTRDTARSVPQTKIEKNISIWEPKSAAHLAFV